MKKLYRKSTVHPTPSAVSDQLLSFLPAAILALTAALSPSDREVLAYLIHSCSSASSSFSNTNNHHRRTAAAQKLAADHAASFNCSCFRCYMSYWVRWDASPNRQLIHEIIDAFEDSLLKKKNKRDRRKGKIVKSNVIVSSSLELVEPDDNNNSSNNNKPRELSLTLTEEECGFAEAAAADGGDSGGAAVSEEEEMEDVEDDEEEEELEKGSVRRFVSFLGERIWSVWG